MQGNEKKHRELLEKIEQANLLRESNVTLRDQLEASNKNLALVESALKAAQSEIEPLKEQVLNLQSDLDVRKDEVESLKQDNSRWKSRTQQILEKYERIDPVEHTKLKEEVEKQKGDLQALQKSVEELTNRTKEEEEKV